MGSNGLGAEADEPEPKAPVAWVSETQAEADRPEPKASVARMSEA
jgi:hypothetical protein